MFVPLERFIVLVVEIFSMAKKTKSFICTKCGLVISLCLTACKHDFHPCDCVDTYWKEVK